MLKLSILLILSSSIAYSATPVKVGFILATMQEERYQKDKQIFEETAKHLGAEVIFASCNNNEQNQATQVDNLLSRGVKALVIQPVNGDTAASFVKQAKKDNVAVVSYDRLISNAPIDAYITEDAPRVGELQGLAAVKATKGKGNYVILMGQAGDPNAEARTSGILKVLKKYPEIKIVAKAYHQGWSPDLAMKTTENALTQNKNNIQAIIANNSGMAKGAVQAVGEQKLHGKIFIAGADADLPAIRDILANKQQMDVYISVADMARKAAETAVALAEKKDFKFDLLTDNGAGKIKTLATPALAVDATNIEERVIKTGFHKKEAVYAK